MEIFAETERLILRELVPSDDKGIFELDSDADVHIYLGRQPIRDIGQARKVIEFIRQQYIDNGIGRWAIIERSTNNFIGWTGLKLIKEPTNNHINYYDLGYRLIKKYWGQGIATESAKAALAYGFNKLKQNEIYAMADVNNLSSGNVLEKAGLSFIEEFIYENEPHNWYKVTREDWLRKNTDIYP
jgi:ribosomal-protein-alanine N-acetyltransferase